MTKGKIRNIVRGLALIAFAVCLLLSRSSYFTDVPMLRVGVTLLMAVLFIDQLLDKSFVGMSIPLGLITCLYRAELGLGDIHYAIIMASFVLIGIGLNVIFGKKPHINVIKDGNVIDIESAGNAEYSEGDGTFDVDNNLGNRTQYIKVQNLKNGNIDNALGQLTVYMNGTTIDKDGAVLDIDNGMGKLNVYFPKEFRVHFNCDNGMGTINMHGECSQDESQPLIRANVDNGMGCIDFYFE
jgi:predicted membrane protein